MKNCIFAYLLFLLLSNTVYAQVSQCSSEQVTSIFYDLCSEELSGTVAVTRPIPIIFHLIGNAQGISKSRLLQQIQLLNTSFINSQYQFSLLGISKPIIPSNLENIVCGPNSSDGESILKDLLAIDTKHIINVYIGNTPSVTAGQNNWATFPFYATSCNDVSFNNCAPNGTLNPDSWQIGEYLIC